METAQHNTINRPATVQPAAVPLKTVQRKALVTPILNRIQTAPKVSSPHDPAEKEAEVTAKKIMRMAIPEGSIAYMTGSGGDIFRQIKPEEKDKKLQTKLQSPYITRFANSGIFTQQKKEEEKIQRKAEDQPQVAPNVTADIQKSMAGGSPLPLNVRRFMEPRFRANFSQVKVHTSDKAAKLNRQLNARAFTMGNHLFFGKEQFKPESHEGKELIAHELTHTIQQGEVIQRSEEVNITQQAPIQVQRWGLSDALNYFADKVYLIPGFRMFTLILGVNPVNMSRVDRSAANILRALVEFIPGGALITQALDNYGIFDKIGNWVEQQIKSLGIVGSTIKQAITEFLDSLSWKDILDLGGVWNRAKPIFTEPIDRIISFAKGLATGILQFIKDAILRPLAKLAEGTRGYDLLKAVLGKDPVTGDPVPRTADTLIGGFMKLIGQEEVWNNLKKANAVARAWAWFQGAMSALMGFIGQIPTLFIQAFKSLQLEDIILLPRAFAKVVAVFGKFIGDFMNWAGNAVWNLLEIIFAVVAPGAIPYLKKAAGAFRSILKNPIGFIGNLVAAIKGGVSAFAGNIWTHLKKGFVQWLFGALTEAGVEIPDGLPSLPSILKLIMNILGLTLARLRAEAIKLLGPTAVALIEKLVEYVQTLWQGGVAGLWAKIKEDLTNLKDMAVDAIQSWLVSTIIKQGTVRLATLFNPAGAIIQAIIAIYNTIQVVIERISQIAAFIAAVINSIAAIASGAISGAIKWIENALAGAIPLAISFLAGLIGLGGISKKVREFLVKAGDLVWGAIRKWIKKGIEYVKKLWGKLTGKKDKADDKEKEKKIQAGLAAIDHAEQPLLKDGLIEKEAAEKVATVVKKQHPVFKSIIVVESEKTFDYKYEASPIRTKKGEKKTDVKGDLKKARMEFKKRLYSREELQTALGVSSSTAQRRIHEWMQGGTLHKLASNTFDPLTQYSFESTKAGQRETNPNNRSKYGYVNPDKMSSVGLQILSIGLLHDKCQKPIEAGNAAYHQKKAWYRSVVTSTIFQFVAAILGHKDPGASGHWNRTGHKQTRSDNLAWNKLLSSYQGPEEKGESSASGSKAERYRIPSKVADSHQSWW